MNRNLFSNRPDFSYFVQEGVLCIVDHDNGYTVTNGAADVIAELREQGVDIESLPVIYRDTSGTWDRIQVKHGVFVGFSSINETQPERAIAKAKRASNS